EQDEPPPAHRCEQQRREQNRIGRPQHRDRVRAEREGEPQLRAGVVAGGDEQRREVRLHIAPPQAALQRGYRYLSRIAEQPCRHAIPPNLAMVTVDHATVVTVATTSRMVFSVLSAHPDGTRRE